MSVRDAPSMAMTRSGQMFAAAFAIVASFAALSNAMADGPVVEPLAVEEIAPGVFAHHGHEQTPNRANNGDIANVGFVIGTEAVAVIDSGGSPTTGERLRAAIRERTELPIRFLINTHVHFDHLFGNGAFGEDYPDLVAHARMQGALMSRADTYLASFENSVGPEEARRVVMLPTDIPVSERATLDLGGRTLEVVAYRTAHTNNDVTVFDSATGTLFAGDLVSLNHIPIVDGSVLGWLEVMDQLATIPAEQVVPGHGPVSAPWPDAMEPQRRYLQGIVAEIRALQGANGTIQQAVSEVGRDAATQWLLFDEYHSRNVTAAFAELEWE